MPTRPYLCPFSDVDTCIYADLRSTFVDKCIYVDPSSVVGATFNSEFEQLKSYPLAGDANSCPRPYLWGSAPAPGLATSASTSSPAAAFFVASLHATLPPDNPSFSVDDNTSLLIHVGSFLDLVVDMPPDDLHYLTADSNSSMRRQELASAPGPSVSAPPKFYSLDDGEHGSAIDDLETCFDTIDASDWSAS